jgi:hypothetical protein
LHVGIYAKSVVGRISGITTYDAHTAIFTELSRLYIEENIIYNNSTFYHKTYGIINTNNSMITVDKVYYKNRDTELTEHLETDDGHFKKYFISNLTEIRKCL